MGCRRLKRLSKTLFDNLIKVWYNITYILINRLCILPLKVSNKKREYRTTGKTIYSCQYHVIWCTKYRRKVLCDQIQNRLKQLIREKQSEYGYNIREIETMPDHVHLLIEIPPSKSIDAIVGKIKGWTSKCLREENPHLPIAFIVDSFKVCKFLWWCDTTNNQGIH